MAAQRERDLTSEDAPPAGQKKGFVWWIRQTILTIIAGFFVWFGVAVMIGAYGLGDPFSFIMTFFAASLIIMISLVMGLAFFMRMRRELKTAPPSEDAGKGSLQRDEGENASQHRNSDGH